MIRGMGRFNKMNVEQMKLSRKWDMAFICGLTKLTVYRKNHGGTLSVYRMRQAIIPKIVRVSICEPL
jgi:hypothetical protein